MDMLSIRPFKDHSGSGAPPARCASVSALNFAAAAFHAAQAVAVLVLIIWLDTKPRKAGMLFDGGRFELVRMVPVWRETQLGSMMIERVASESGSIDGLYVILAFFVLSAVFQCAGGLLQGIAAMGRLRFIEYSFSASIMMLLIALEAGIQDLYTLQCMFVLTWATQMFGLLADIISNFAIRPLLLGAYDDYYDYEDDDETETVLRFATARKPAAAPPRPVDAAELWLWVLPHAAGWATCMSAYGPAIDIFLQSRARSERQPPSFVTALIFVELVMFSCFGVVQTYGLLSKTLLCVGWGDPAAASVCNVLFREPPPAQPHSSSSSSLSLGAGIRRINVACEYAFIVLSLVAKTLLCWIVLSPIVSSRLQK